METRKYKIAVFTDLKKSANETIKGAIKLAQIVNGDIEVFNVKSPTDIIRKDNHLVAIRSLKDQHILTKQRMNNLINPFKRDTNLNINYDFAFGNVKKHLSTYLEDKKPDIVVMGKRRPKFVNFIGDSITDFVLQKHSGLVMIADQNNILEDTNELTLGLLNGRKDSFNSELIENLMQKTQAPLKTFKIVHKEEDLLDSQPLNTKKAVEYVFEQNDQAVNYVTNYLSKSKVNLLFVKRKDAIKNKLNRSTKVRELIAKSNVSILLA